MQAQAAPRCSAAFATQAVKKGDKVLAILTHSMLVLQAYGYTTLLTSLCIHHSQRTRLPCVVAKLKFRSVLAQIPEHIQVQIIGEDGNKERVTIGDVIKGKKVSSLNMLLCMIRTCLLA